MSHELRTPLNAILGFAELLKNQSFGPLGSARYVGYAADILVRNGGTAILSETPEIYGAEHLLTRRAVTLRNHAGQISFPGGRQDDPAEDLIVTALREAQEEVGLDTREPTRDVARVLSGMSSFDLVAVIAFVFEPRCQ